MEKISNSVAPQMSVDDIVKGAETLSTEEELVRIERTRMLNEARIRPTDVIPEQQYLLEIDGKKLLQTSAISFISGKKKQGKTAACSAMVAAVLREGGLWRMKNLVAGGKVLYLDLEQNHFEALELTKRVQNLTTFSDEQMESQFVLLGMRGYSIQERVDLLKMALEDYDPVLVVIDGIVDLCLDFNNLQESQETVLLLMQLSSEYHCCILNVLHENPGSDKMRGHLGTIGEQKASEIFVLCHSKGVFTVSNPVNRHVCVPSWSYCYDEEGNLISGEEAARNAAAESAAKKADMQKASKEKKLHELKIDERVKEFLENAADKTATKLELSKMLQTTEPFVERRRAYEALRDLEQLKKITFDGNFYSLAEMAAETSLDDLFAESELPAADVD